MYLRSVEDGWNRQHGDNDQDVSTAAHVTGHNQHLGEGGVQGELHHQTSCWCQSTWKYIRKQNYARCACDVKTVRWTGQAEDKWHAAFPSKAFWRDGEPTIMWHLFITVRGGWTADSREYSRRGKKNESDQKLCQLWFKWLDDRV